MSGAVAVRDLDPGEYAAWNEVLEDAPTGSVYATPEYLEALCGATGGRFSIRAAFRGEEIVGGVGLYCEGEGIHTVASPRLLLFYHGPVLRRYATRDPGKIASRQVATLEALERSLSSERFGRIVLKGSSALTDVRPFLASGWEAVPKYTLVVDLEDLDALWKRVDRNVRRLVRRAAERGLTVTEDDDFDSFFRLHREVHERKDAPLYLPQARFRRFFESLRGQRLVRLYHARLPDGRAVSSQMVVANGHPVTHTVSAASDAEHGDTGASAFLRWKVFEDLRERGFLANDLTGAGLGPVARFKHQLGGELRVCFEVSRTRSGFRALQIPRTFQRRGRGWAGRLLASLTDGRT